MNQQNQRNCRLKTLDGDSPPAENLQLLEHGREGVNVLVEGFHANGIFHDNDTGIVFLGLRRRREGQESPGIPEALPDALVLLPKSAAKPSNF